MSILIKGLEMPKSCRSCGLLQEFDERYWCACNGYLVFGDIENVPDYVMNGCPLVEIPKHGRLIDADKLFVDIEWHDIEEAPTIIEGDTE